MRIGILLTNNGRVGLLVPFPNDGEKVASQLALVRPSWMSRVWSVKDGQLPDVNDAEAFIITGSPASVHDPFPWIEPLSRLIKTIHRHQRPLIGLCFGHQLIATALGGKVGRSPTGWRFGSVDTLFVEHLP